MRSYCAFCAAFYPDGFCGEVYAPKGWSVAYYSLIYNGSYMLPNIIIGVIVILIIGKTAPGFLFQKQELGGRCKLEKKVKTVSDYFGNCGGCVVIPFFRRLWHHVPD